MIFYVLPENPSLLWGDEGVMPFCENKVRQIRSSAKRQNATRKYQRLIGDIFARPTQFLSVYFLDPNDQLFMHVEAADIPFTKK